MEINMLENKDIKEEYSDFDDSDEAELLQTFPTKCSLLSEEVINLDKYILHMSGTLLSSNPYVAAALSDYTVCVYNVNNEHLTKINTILGYKSPIIGLKNCSDNINLLYVSCEDFVDLWDLRDTKQHVLRFRDTTQGANLTKGKVFSSFDVSHNNRLLAVGTEVFEIDAFILFWDIRNVKLLGGYWESHTDVVTQVKFHDFDPNKLISGSTDGLINVYDLNQSTEDNALVETLNTESSIEQLKWYALEKKTDAIFCATHTHGVQLWKLGGVAPFADYPRCILAKSIKLQRMNDCYIVDCHQQENKKNDLILLLGSNAQCFRGVSIKNKEITPCYNFTKNDQRVRCSFYHEHLNLLATGGERGILSLWKLENVSL